MLINIHTPSSLVRFGSLNNGDVFRIESDGICHYFLKVESIESRDSGSRNCVDLTANVIGWLSEKDFVYKVQSAELNVTN